MAKDKNSFLLYCDLIHTVEHLPDETAGQLFKTILQYVNDHNPEPNDIILKIAFEPIKRQLKRDLNKWDKYIEKQSVNGKLGGRPPKANETQKTQPFLEKPKKADSVNVSVSVNDNVIVKREKGFAPPAKDEVVELMVEKLDDFSAMGEADKFINFYQSKNWYVGKTKMKDWRAAARGWLSRMNDFKTERNGQQRKQGTSEARIEALKNF